MKTAPIWSLILFLFLFISIISCTNSISSLDANKIKSDLLNVNSIIVKPQFISSIHVEGTEIYIYSDSINMNVLYKYHFNTDVKEGIANFLYEYKYYNGYMLEEPAIKRIFTNIEFKELKSIYKTNLGFGICNDCNEEMDSTNIPNFDPKISYTQVDSFNYILSYKQNDTFFVELKNVYLNSTEKQLIVQIPASSFFVFVYTKLIDLGNDGTFELAVIKVSPIRDSVYDIDFYRLN